MTGIEDDPPGPMARAVKWLLLLMYRMRGWKAVGNVPEPRRFILIAAPHTSNWDLPNTLMAGFALRANLYWMGKRSIFRPPFGAFMRWLGGIAVNREKSNNLVAASVEAIRAARGSLQLVVPPEGTRSKVRYWKTGFYYIAHGAGVPIVLSYMDYARKVSGIGPVFHPTGDIERDMATIKAFYAPFKGKNPDQSGH